MNVPDSAWRDQPFVVVDVETTGLDAATDRIIEIGIVRFEGGLVVERYGQLLDPERDVPEEVVRLTGIKPEDLVGQPKFVDVAAEVHQRLAGGVIVAYNLSFDRGFIARELERAGLGWPLAAELDPLVFVRQLHRNQGSKKLGAVAARLGITLENAHRAVDDSEVAGRVLLALADQLPAHLGDLVALQRQWETLQAAEQLRWRRNRENSAGLLDDPSAAADDPDGRPSLGPAYIWGDETDFMRAMFATLPDVGSRR